MYLGAVGGRLSLTKVKVVTGLAATAIPSSSAAVAAAGVIGLAPKVTLYLELVELKPLRFPNLPAESKATLLAIRANVG
jgi:hypothetical protein